MKNLILIISLLFVLTGCKTRNVAISHKDSTSVKQSTTSLVTMQKGIDTSKRIEQKQTTEVKHIKLTDSSGTVTEITPVAGTQISVDAKGVFHGEATSVKTTRHQTKHKDEALNKAVQQNVTTKKGIDNTKTKALLKTAKDSVSVKIDNKSVVATASYWWILKLLLFLAALAAGYYLYKRYKPG